MGCSKAVLRVKFLMIKLTSGNKKNLKIKILNLHLKQLEKEEQITPKVSRWKGIIKIRAEINEIQTT